MSLPIPSLEWKFSPNNRVSFVSLNNTMSKLLFGIKNFLVTLGWTVKYTCDGTTGPTSAGDHTDRWSSAANATTRFNGAGGAQSFAVLTDAQGADTLLTYDGASDDIALIAFSPGGLYVPAGTSNQKPTATDEQTLASGSTIINATTSGDRIFHVMATSGLRHWRCFIYRQSSMLYAFGVERCVPSTIPNITFSPPVVGWATTVSTPSSVGSGHVMGSGTATNGGHALINGVSGVLGGAGEGYAGSYVQNGLNSSTSCELQGAAIIVPCGWSTTSANISGKVGSRTDTWYAYCPTLNQGETFGDLTLVMFGTAINPWDAASYPVIS